MSRSQVYKKFLKFLYMALLVVSLSACFPACTEAELAECVSYGLSYSACVIMGEGGIPSIGGGGGGDTPAENADNSQ